MEPKWRGTQTALPGCDYLALRCCAYHKPSNHCVGSHARGCCPLMRMYCARMRLHRTHLFCSNHALGIACWHDFILDAGHTTSLPKELAAACHPHAAATSEHELGDRSTVWRLGNRCGCDQCRAVFEVVSLLSIHAELRILCRKPIEALKRI